MVIATRLPATRTTIIDSTRAKPESERDLRAMSRLLSLLGVMEAPVAAKA
jgi:hypothetical protein